MNRVAPWIGRLSRREGAAPTRRERVGFPIVVMVCLTLAACGFQLRGTAELDPGLSPLGIETVHPGSSLLPPLRHALADAGVEVARPNSQVAAILRILEDESGERILAVTPEGRPRVAELFHRVVFELHDAGGELVPPRTLVMTREYAVDERDVLGQAQEAQVLRQALQRDIVAALVRQLGTVEAR